ncbi:ras-induced vulval development antagonist-domain-containing protein [Flammula alnicola]|nr:ras-induced vulval development antagonist-domain-containing protein [Flammula alnicola]
MATVHPSRMGLIPQDMRETHSDRTRGRSPSPRRSHRSPSPVRSRSRDRERGKDDGRGRDSGYDGDRRGGRADSRDRGRDGYRPTEARRASPKYDDYRRPPPPAGGESSAPWRQQDSIYPGKHDYHRGGAPYGAGAGAGGAGFLESRRAQREAQTVNVWPPSPKAPARELLPKGKKSSKNRRDTGLHLQVTRLRRKKKGDEREKSANGPAELARRRKRRTRNGTTNHGTATTKRATTIIDAIKTAAGAREVGLESLSRSRSPARMDEDHLEKHRHPSPPAPISSDLHTRQLSNGPPLSATADAEDDSEDELGPQPLQRKGGNKKVDERSYGGALLRGEGSAMAAFLQEGTESRIPRRGEIGLTSDEIAKYEDVGYVMSGSRHRRMNAVRMRKENQVISAEEKRGILKLQREERERKEAILRDEFSLLVNEKLKAT